jgi:hypothetical protein
MTFLEASWCFALNKIHRTLRMRPAMAAGVTNRLFEVHDLVASWEESERAAAWQSVERRIRHLLIGLFLLVTVERLQDDRNGE